MNFKINKSASIGGAAASVLLVSAAILNAMPAAAVDFANPAFQRTWDRTDSLVASGQVSRTWFWGPEPRAAAQEQYTDAPDGTGTRLVQYFDKSRMEINNPGADPNSTFFVTNGLLTIELISGQMQIGNNAFINRYPAEIPIAGDTDDVNAPTYASFGAVSNTRKGDHPQPNRVGQYATGTINKLGQVGDDQSKVSDNSKIAYFEPTTQHNIPNIFWGFLNASGPISQSGQIVNARLIDPWFYASGLPISDAYWSTVKIQGVEENVMIQAFERRVLTYVPTNPPGFQVEMGNIGLHYYDWRYKDAGKPTVVPGAPTSTAQATGTPPTATSTAVGSATASTTPPNGSPQPSATNTNGPSPTGTPPTATPSATATINIINQGAIVFASNRNGNFDIFRMKGDGTTVVQLTTNPANDDWPSYSPDYSKILFTSTRDANDEEIYVMNADGSGQTRLTNSLGRDYEPAWSPDGNRIVFVSDRDASTGDLYVMNSNGTGLNKITVDPAPDVEPSWGANGRIVFTSKRSGTEQIYTVNPDGSGLAGPLTSAGNNYQPKWNTLGNRITFVSDRDGPHQEVYTMRSGGEEQFRLTNNTFDDQWPSYSPDNSRIVFTSQRNDPSTPNDELYTMTITGTDQEKITINDADDTHASWGVQVTR